MIAFQALVYGAGLLVATGLVMQWGEWYAPWEAYRDQSRALLAGRLALSREVADLLYNHTWSEGGVHQVWGLGVSVWRLPWDMLARAFGHEAFPDRIAFGLFAALAAHAVLKVWMGPLISPGEKARMGAENETVDLNGVTVDGLALAVGAAGVLILLLLFPPFIGLLRARGPAWEEPVAYLYLYGVLMVTLLAAWARHPGTTGWFCLCLLAGLGGFIRPTLVLYGLVTIAVGTFVLLHTRPSWKSAIVFGLVGWMLFAFCGGLLWWTNLRRFGDGFEFGHKLNVQHQSGAMYATRFDYPFEDEPVGSAARELFGSLFRVRELNGVDFYRTGFIDGQSDTVRWRNFYFRTYDLSHVACVLGGWALTCWLIWRGLCRCGFSLTQCSRRGTLPDVAPATPAMSVILGLGVWSLLTSALLTLFYLWVPVISSRYMLDFAPAFATGMVVLWLFVASRCRKWWQASLLFLFLAAWLGTELYLNRSLPGSLGSMSWEEVSRARQRQPVAGLPRVSDYGCALGDPASGIPFDRTGWDQETGALNPLVILFVNDPEFLELELEEGSNAEQPADPEAIRVKVGLEPLQRVGIHPKSKGWRVRFQGPRQPRYKRGLQYTFVATVPKEQFADANTPWVLRSVRWRE